MKFSEYILSKRKQLLLSQAGFATRLGTHVNTVSLWERGVSFPDDAQIAKLAKLIGESFEHIWAIAHPEIAKKLDFSLADMNGKSNAQQLSEAFQKTAARQSLEKEGYIKPTDDQKEWLEFGDMLTPEQRHAIKTMIDPKFKQGHPKKKRANS